MPWLASRIEVASADGVTPDGDDQSPEAWTVTEPQEWKLKALDFGSFYYPDAAADDARRDAWDRTAGQWQEAIDAARNASTRDEAQEAIDRASKIEREWGDDPLNESEWGDDPLTQIASDILGLGVA